MQNDFDASLEQCAEVLRSKGKMQFGKRERNHKEGAPLGMDACSRAWPMVSSLVPPGPAAAQVL